MNEHYLTDHHINSNLWFVDYRSDNLDGGLTIVEKLTKKQAVQIES